MSNMTPFLFQKPIDPGTLNKLYTRTGYLFLMEKKALGTTWNKYYCHYQRSSRLFCMVPYNQTTAKGRTDHSHMTSVLPHLFP